jgi:hypothetical protein
VCGDIREFSVRNCDIVDIDSGLMEAPRLASVVTVEAFGPDQQQLLNGLDKVESSHPSPRGHGWFESVVGVASALVSTRRGPPKACALHSRTSFGISM